MVSMANIADACKVSRTVVSMVLNGHDKKYKVSAKTRDLVLKTSHAMGYCRDEVATSMASKQGNILAFVTEPMGDIAYTGRILNGILDAAAANELMLMTLHLTQENHQQVLQKIIGWRVRGVIFHISMLQHAADLMEKLKDLKIPAVTVNLSNQEALGITTDDASGIYEMVALFKKHGAAKPVLLLPHVESKSDYLETRINGFRKGIKKFYPGMKPMVYDAGGEIPCVAPDTPAKIRKAGGDAVICIADDHALRFWQCALQTGFSIPGDFLLSGFGSTYAPELTQPVLTTVEQNFEMMGRLATEMIIGNEKKKNVLLPVSIREGGTANFHNKTVIFKPITTKGGSPCK